MMLESYCHDQSSFITLTYADDHLPEGGSLDPSHLRNFLKRLRKSLEPRRIRFFSCGEYGDLNGRPHYHAILFGVSYLDLQSVAAAWNLGAVSWGEVNEQTCQYTAGYVVKKLTASDDPRLGGRYPEFSRMSLRPGIGAPALAVLSSTLSTGKGSLILQGSDVPDHLKFGRRNLPLGRYLHSKLRAEWLTPSAIERLKEQLKGKRLEELLAVYPHAADASIPLAAREALIREKLLEASAGSRANLVARHKIKASRRTL